MFFIFELHLLHILKELIKDHIQMVASLDFYEIFYFIKLL